PGSGGWGGGGGAGGRVLSRRPPPSPTSTGRHATSSHGWRVRRSATRTRSGEDSDARALRDEGTLERVPLAESDAVDVAQHDPVRLPQGGLRVGDVVFAAVFGDDRRRATKVRPGHRREEVVLDLVVEPAHHEVAERGAADVAAHQ